MKGLSVSVRSEQLSLAFSCAGHAVSHLFAPTFFVVALALEKDWALSHGEAVALIVAGNALFGIAAPLAGWLGDRWSSTSMMALFFLGTGAGMVMTGFASTPLEMAVWLGATGLFAAIYHPVGIAWLVRNAESRGTALGINGAFGVGAHAAAPLAAGALTDAFGWPAAFAVPGVLVIAIGIAFTVLLARGTIVEARIDRRPDPVPPRGDRVRAVAFLAVTMLCAGVIYQSLMAAAPKLMSERLVDWVGEGVFGISVLYALVYGVAMVANPLIGRLADRYPPRLVYLSTYVCQVPGLVLAAAAGGPLLVAALAATAALNMGAQPVENTLVARYAPSRWRGLAFGLKFILTFGLCGALGPMLEGAVFDATGGFYWLLIVLAALATVGIATTWLLPDESRAPVAAVAE